MNLMYVIGLYTCTVFMNLMYMYWAIHIDGLYEPDVYVYGYIDVRFL